VALILRVHDSTEATRPLPRENDITGPCQPPLKESRTPARRYCVPDTPRLQGADPAVEAADPAEPITDPVTNGWHLPVTKAVTAMATTRGERGVVGKERNNRVEPRRRLHCGRAGIHPSPTPVVARWKGGAERVGGAAGFGFRPCHSEGEQRAGHGKRRAEQAKVRVTIDIFINKKITS
jgi:hypothetical protein